MHKFCFWVIFLLQQKKIDFIVINIVYVDLLGDLNFNQTAL